MQTQTTQRGLFITGTDTAVGKTFIGAQLVSALRGSGINVQPRKPVESGCHTVDGELFPADGHRYFLAVNGSIELQKITPFRFRAALAPPQAAVGSSQRISLDELQAAVLDDMPDDALCVVEGAGGFYSPIADDGLNADLARRLQMPVLVVATNKLGCINHVLLTLKAIRDCGLQTLAVVLNQIDAGDASTAGNADALNNLVDVPIVSITKQQRSAAAIDELLRLL